MNKEGIHEYIGKYYRSGHEYIYVDKDSGKKLGYTEIIQFFIGGETVAMRRRLLSEMLDEFERHYTEITQSEWDQAKSEFLKNVNEMLEG